MLNRLHLVCNVHSSNEDMVMKINFDLMRQHISTLMESVKKH